MLTAILMIMNMCRAGDIAFRFLDYIKNESSNIQQRPMQTDSGAAKPRETHVTVSDINQAMLDVGKQKAVARGLQQTGA